MRKAATSGISGVVVGLFAAFLLGGGTPAIADTHDVDPLLGVWGNMACNHAGSRDEDVGEVYHVSVLVGMDSVGGLEGPERNARAQDPRDAKNGVSAANIRDLVLISERDHQAVFATLNADGRPESVVVVTNFNGEWIATDGLFCSLDDVWYGR